MSKRKLKLAVSLGIILLFAIIIYSYKQTSKLNPISSKDVKLVNRVGGLPLSRWKVLYASKDDTTIEKIIALVNSAKKTGFSAKDYGSGKAIGYPISIEIRLKNDIDLNISPLFKVITEKLASGGMMSTAIPYNDRVELDIENGKKSYRYTLYSEQLADYVLKGADQDMPYLRAFSITPEIIKPGQRVTISGEGSTKDYIEIYISDGNSDSNEKYLIAKVPTSFGSWKWEGVIEGRNIRTIDGSEIKLTKDSYYFETTVAGGGTIDLSGCK